MAKKDKNKGNKYLALHIQETTRVDIDEKHLFRRPSIFKLTLMSLFPCMRPKKPDMYVRLSEVIDNDHLDSYD